MTHADFLQRYFDEDLSSTEEEVFFAAVARDGDLRRAFNDQIRIQTAIRNGAAGTAPPAHLTGAIFSTLGYSLTPGTMDGSSASAGGVAGSTFGETLRTIIPYLLTALLASAATMLFINSGETTPAAPRLSARLTDNGAPIRMQEPVAERMEDSVAPHPEQMQEARRTERVSGTTTGTRARIAAEVRTATTNPGARAFTNSPPASVLPDTAIQESRPEPVAIERTSLRSSDGYHTDIADLPPDAQPLPLTVTDLPVIEMPDNVAEGKQPDLELQLQGIRAASFPTVNLASGNLPWLRNIGAAALYRINENHAVGLELGRHTIGQEFRQQIDGHLILVRQNPALVQGAALYQLDLPQFNISGVLHPYLDVRAGFSEVGPLAGGTVGARFGAGGPLSFLLGVQGTTLWYGSQGVLYNSSRLGLVYGAALRF